MSREHIQFLSGSAKRIQLLRALRKQPARQCELMERCSVSRPAVWRSLAGFSDRNWVKEDSGLYRITIIGEFVLSHYETLAEVIDCAGERARFFDHLGDIGSTFPAEALAETTVVTATPEKPSVALNRFRDALTTSTTEQFRALVPGVRRVVEEVSWHLSTMDAAFELIVGETALELQTVPDALVEARSHEWFRFYMCPKPLEFGMLLSDDYVLVSAYDEWGNLRSCLEGMNEPLLEWAVDIYKEHRQDATPADAISGLPQI